MRLYEFTEPKDYDLTDTNVPDLPIKIERASSADKGVSLSRRLRKLTETKNA